MLVTVGLMLGDEITFVVSGTERVKLLEVTIKTANVEDCGPIEVTLLVATVVVVAGMAEVKLRDMTFVLLNESTGEIVLILDVTAPAVV